MATLPINDRLISLEEYLSTCYESDREFDDGLLVERNKGEFDHSFLQTFLGSIFTNNMERWGVFGLTEQRVQIKPRKFFIPDVCVLRMGLPREKILTRPPLIAIEIISPEDRLRLVAAKAIEYLEFGVEHVWGIDPGARVAYRGTPDGLQLVPGGELTVPGTPILVRVPELFEKLDRM